MTDDLPPPDLLDERGRMRRLVLSFVLACVAGAIAYVVFDRLAEPDGMPGGFDGGSQRRAYQFVFYFTGAVFAGVFIISLLVQNHLAKKAYERELGLPKAKLKK